MFLQKTKFPGLHQLGIHSLKHLTVDVIASAAKTNTQKHTEHHNRHKTCWSRWGTSFCWHFTHKDHTSNDRPNHVIHMFFSIWPTAEW